MEKSRFIKTGLLLFPMLIGGVAAKEAIAQTKKTNLKSVMVLEHGTSDGHRQSSNDLNATLRDLGTANGFMVKVLAQSVNLDVEFSAENLAKHQVVVFSNNDGINKFITGTARNNFQTYVENGGGLLAVHASSAFVSGWTWIDNALVQKFYGPHQANGPSADLKQDAEGLKTDSETRGILKDFTAAPNSFRDEYYQFETSPRGKPGVTILLTVAENTSTISFQSPMGADHPVTWAKTVGKGRVVHNSLGHSFGGGHNTYTQKTNYLKNFTYTSLRYAAGDFTGCMNKKFEEFSPDAIKSDSTQCKTPSIALLQFNKDAKQNGLPLISRNETGALVDVEFFNQGPNAITITDVTGKRVYQKTGSGQARYAVPTPRKSGIYIVKAKSAGKVSSHRVTVL
jgi:type 1 glutamine amidotransferase